VYEYLFLKEQLRHVLWQTFKSLPKLVTDNQTLTIKKNDTYKNDLVAIFF